MAKAGLCRAILVVAALLSCQVQPVRAEATAPAIAAPPRTTADITAILDQEQPDPAKIAARTQAMSAPPPAGLAELELAKFYADRSRAASALGRITQAIADVHRALDIARQHQADKPDSYVLYLDMLRSLESRITDIPAAMAASREIIGLTEGKGRPDGRTFLAYQTLITDTAQSGRLDEANALLLKLGPLVRQQSLLPASAPYRSGYGWCLDRAHGVVSLNLGKLDEAAIYLQNAVSEGEQAAKDAEPVNRYVALSWASAASYSQRELALVYLGQGRIAEAEVAVRQALLRELRSHGRYAVETVDMIATLGTVMTAAGRFGEAEKLERIAVDTYVALGVDDASRALNTARAALASTLVAQRRWADALAQIDLIDKGLAGEPAYARHIRRINWTIIMAAIWGGRPQQAVEWARQAMEDTANELGPAHYRTAFQTALYADALAAAGQLDAARTSFAKAVPILLAGSGQATDDPGQARVDRWRSAVLDGYLGVLADDGSPAAAQEAFRIADAARGQTVQRAVAAAAARSAMRDPANADLIRREQDAKRQVDALTQLLASGYALPTGERDDAALAKLRKEIDQRTTDHEALRAEIERRIPDYARLNDPQPATVADAQRALLPGEALIAIYVSVKRTYVWAVTKSGPVAFAASPLSRHDINGAVDDLRKALDPDASTAGEIPAFDTATAYKLYAGLLEPVKAGWQGAGTLLIVANGALGQLPFGLLTTENATPAADQPGSPLFAGYKAVPWLIRQVAVAQLPSVTSLTTLRAAPQATGQRKPFIGFGDPWFSQQEATQARLEQNEPRAVDVAGAAVVEMRKAPVKLRSVPKTEDANRAVLADLPRLPETAAEVTAAAEALRADPAKDVYLGAQANEQMVESLKLDDRRVIMFATHGLVPGDLDGLNEPALALSAPEVTKTPGDGLLTVSKILGLRLNADWVVLSACNTAAGNGAGAEAVSGLGLAFFYAGTRALLVSNWPVETNSARALTSELFRREAARPGLGRAEALRQSMIALMDSPGFVGPDGKQVLFSYAHPIFWAPFSLVGDGGGE